MTKNIFTTGRLSDLKRLEEFSLEYVFPIWVTVLYRPSRCKTKITGLQLYFSKPKISKKKAWEDIKRDFPKHVGIMRKMRLKPKLVEINSENELLEWKKQFLDYAINRELKLK